jgi:LacI family transcriptional regulator
MAVEKIASLINGSSPRVRMIDIARQAGVSRSAVSLVLSGQEERVGRKTAERIRHIARQLNFHPDHAARQLAGKRSGIIAALGSRWASDQTQTRLLVWLNHEAAVRGLAILAEEIESAPDALEKFVNKCLSWNVDGIIFTALSNDWIWPAVAAALAHVPRVVSVLGDAGIPNSYRVELDVEDGVRQAVRHLHEQGRRRIVLVLEALDYQINCRRHRAFLDAHAELGIACGEGQVCLATRGWSESDIANFDALRDELLDERSADAVLADSDFTAAGLLAACHRRGVRVPDDLALVGWGNTVVARWIDPLVTTVDFLPQQLMGKALDLMTALIDRPAEEQPRLTQLKPQLMVRASG